MEKHEKKNNMLQLRFFTFSRRGGGTLVIDFDVWLFMVQGLCLHRAGLFP